MHPASFLDREPFSPPPQLQLAFSTSSSSDGKRQNRQRETRFLTKHGRRHHAFDSEKAPYPLSYDKQVVEMEALDNRLTHYLRKSSSFVNFEEPPTRVLDLGCGTGVWIIEAAREWPDCEFVGFDLVNVQHPTKFLDRSISKRIQWKHGNFLTTKLPFDDDEFDHIHIKSIARGVPENKWGNLFEEINRVLVPGGSIEMIEDDIVFPVLPRWFTDALRATPRPSTSPGRHSNGMPTPHRPFTPSTMTNIPSRPPHDHALLESLYKSVFENRFINTTPTAVLPSYFTTYFRHVTVSPVVTYPMPLLSPPLPLPPQMVTTYVIEPNSDELQRRVSTISPSTFSSSRPMSLSFSSSSTTSTASTVRSQSSSVFSKRPRTASASLSSPWSTSSASIPLKDSAVPREPLKPIFRPFMLDSSPNDDDSTPFPSTLFSLDQLRNMSERSLAMHLYQSYQTVLACQEAMWEELKDRIRNRREELAPVGWEDDELGELENRKRFEKLIERFRSDMHIRISLWTSLTGFGWEVPTREPLSKAELIEEERVREGLTSALKSVSLDDVQTPCRSTGASSFVVSNQNFGERCMAVHSNVLSPQGRMPVKQKKPIAVSNKGKGKENVQNVRWEEHNAWAKEPEQEAPWEWKYLNDFSSSKVPPLFSKDGSYFFCLAGLTIKIFSVASGQVVSELILPSGDNASAQNSRFTAAVINPHNFFQLITSTLDGRLLIWDFLNGALLRQIDIGKPIHFLCAHEKFKDNVIVAASKRTASENDAVVLRISLKTPPAGKSMDTQLIGKTRAPSGLSFSSNGSWIVASAGHTVYVARSSALEAGFVKYVSPERLTCLAMHPSEDYFATGDDKGNIRIWYCLNSSVAGTKGVEQRSQTTSLHWHAHPVSALSFTPNGAYLLSGGEEAVLVMWQIHSGKKEFVPRVGAPISTISICRGPTGEEYLLGLNDGTFSFVSSSTFRITRSFSQIKIDPATTDAESSSSKSPSLPLAYHPLSSSIILASSHPQSLQIYSPASSTLLSELEVSPSNRVSKRDDKPVELSCVRHVALSSCGLWMATLDARNGEAGYAPEIFLKIWSWNEKLAKWILHSRIDQPHGVSHVLSLSFSPRVGQDSPLYLATCSEDGSLKIWRLKTKTRETVWTPHASLDFPTSRPRSVDWSSDGTIFSLTFDTRVILYDSTSISVLTTISCSSFRDAISSSFIGSRHLLVVTKRSLLLWDLILESASWTYSSEKPISYVIPHPDAESFAVFHVECGDTKHTSVQVFGVLSPTPRATQSVPLALVNATWFGGASQDAQRTFNLVALTETSKVVVLGNDPNVAQSKPSSMTLGFASARPSLFQDIFGSPLDAGSSTATDPSTSSAPTSLAATQEAFPYPAYLTPSLSSMCNPVLEGFLHVRDDSSGKGAKKEKDEDSDEEMEDDAGSLVTSKPSTTLLAFAPDHLVQLFKKQMTSSLRTPARPNGVAKVNGVHPRPESASRKDASRTHNKVSV